MGGRQSDLNRVDPATKPWPLSTVSHIPQAPVSRLPRHRVRLWPSPACAGRAGGGAGPAAGPEFMAALIGAGLRSRSWQANAARMQLAQNTERDGIDFERNRRFTLRHVHTVAHSGSLRLAKHMPLLGHAAPKYTATTQSAGGAAVVDSLTLLLTQACLMTARQLRVSG